MDKFIKIVIIVIVFMISLFTISSVLAGSSDDLDSISFATYYPAPYGVYNEMRLYPHNPATTACNSNEEAGTMYYDSVSKKLMVCNGSAWVTTDAGVQQGSGRKIYANPGSYTFVVPSGITTLWVSMAGGGGGGGAGFGCTGMAGYGGGGGGGDSIHSFPITVTPNQSIGVVVGAGGIGGITGMCAAGSGPGGAGGVSSITVNGVVTTVQGGGGGGPSCCTGVGTPNVPPTGGVSGGEGGIAGNGSIGGVTLLPFGVGGNGGYCDNSSVFEFGCPNSSGTNGTTGYKGANGAVYLQW